MTTFKLNPGRIVLMLFAVLVALPLSACGLESATPTPLPTATPVGKVITTGKGQYRDITADELKVMMEHKDFFHVDVHIPNEGQMPQLDARIPYDKITEQLDKLPTDKASKIVLTCKSGGMSTDAAKKLADLGYTNVYNLSGGFMAWKAKGYEFTSEP